MMKHLGDCELLPHVKDQCSQFSENINRLGSIDGLSWYYKIFVGNTLNNGFFFSLLHFLFGMHHTAFRHFVFVSCSNVLVSSPVITIVMMICKLTLQRLSVWAIILTFIRRSGFNKSSTRVTFSFHKISKKTLKPERTIEKIPQGLA